MLTKLLRVNPKTLHTHTHTYTHAPRRYLSTTTLRMAPSVLGLGIPHTSPLTPDARREALREALEIMETDMNASPYEWDMFYVDPDMEFDALTKKLREKEWDVVMVGMGLRTVPQLIPFFEKIVNTVHAELPKTKFAFNTEIPKTQDAVRRVAPL